MSTPSRPHDTPYRQHRPSDYDPTDEENDDEVEGSSAYPRARRRDDYAPYSAQVPLAGDDPSGIGDEEDTYLNRRALRRYTLPQPVQRESTPGTPSAHASPVAEPGTPGAYPTPCGDHPSAPVILEQQERPVWDQPHRGKTWRDMPGGDEFAQKCHFFFFRRGMEQFIESEDEGSPMIQVNPTYGPRPKKGE